jgi:hypothetical protein
MLSAVDEMPKLAHLESPASRIPRRAHEARAVTANNRPLPLVLMPGIVVISPQLRNQSLLLIEDRRISAFSR